jgi:hypothetical protein
MESSSSSSSSPLTVEQLLAQNEQYRAQIVELNRQGNLVVAQRDEKEAALRQAQAKRPKLPAPGKFSGESGAAVDEWLDELAKQFRYYEGAFVSDTVRIEFATMLLSGKAASWFTATATELQAKGEDIATWDEFVSQLRSRYQPIEATVVARQRLDNLKQERRSVQVYAEFFYKQMNYIKDMAVADQIHIFVRGLSREIKTEVLKSKPASVLAAVNAAHSAESYLGLAHRSQAGSYPQYGRATAAAASSSSAMDLSVSAVQEEDEDEEIRMPNFAGEEPHHSVLAMLHEMRAAQKAQEARLNALFQQNKSGGSKAASSGSDRDRVPGVSKEEVKKCREKGLCIKCKKPGHFARECTFSGPAQRLNW